MKRLFGLLLVIAFSVQATGVHARYLQADPLGLIDGPSVYGYAKQSPMRYTDPRGQAAQACLIPGVGQAVCGTVIEVCVAAGAAALRFALRQLGRGTTTIVLNNDCTDDDCGGADGDDLLDITDHAWDRMRERNITPNQIRDTLQNPKRPPELQPNGNTRVEGQTATVILNENGGIVTVY